MPETSDNRTRSPFTVLRHDSPYHGRVFTVERDEVRHESGYEGVREVVRHNGGAVVVGLLPGARVLLIRQYRYPIGEAILELPAGKLDPGEEPEACARRELREETGWTAQHIEQLGVMLTTPGFCSEALHLFLAEDLIPGDQRLEQGEESIEVRDVPFAEAMAMCASGDIRDGKTITALTLAGLRRGLLRSAAPEGGAA